MGDAGHNRSSLQAARPAVNRRALSLAAAARFLCGGRVRSGQAVTARRVRLASGGFNWGYAFVTMLPAARRGDCRRPLAAGFKVRPSILIIG